MNGLFVTGTDTGIGKTMVCAWLVRNWGADYWKPVQSGAAEGTDAEQVAMLAPGTTIHPSAYDLTAPLSPHEAARQQDVVIDLESITLPRTPRPLVVEGAGGVMVPLNDTMLMVDLMVRLGLPALVVSCGRLGTINHTLMTLDILRRRNIPILGVVMNGSGHPSNGEAIAHYGKVKILAELPQLPAITPALIDSMSPPAFAIPGTQP
jgi:dethiobiotin synthetase